MRVMMQVFICHLPFSQTKVFGRLLGVNQASCQADIPPWRFHYTDIIETRDELFIFSTVNVNGQLA